MRAIPRDKSRRVWANSTHKRSTSPACRCESAVQPVTRKVPPRDPHQFHERHVFPPRAKRDVLSVHAPRNKLTNPQHGSIMKCLRECIFPVRNPTRPTVESRVLEYKTCSESSVETISVGKNSLHPHLHCFEFKLLQHKKKRRKAKPTHNVSPPTGRTG